jgi:hypothetical protein
MTPDWAKSLPWDLIRKNADDNRLDPYVVAAILQHESAGQNFKPRFEPGFRWFWFPREFAERLGISVETEQALQQTSWGAMQIMGAVARQHGFKDDIPKLCQPELSIQYGCAHLKWLRDRPICHSETDLIASYNMGSPRKTPGGLYQNSSQYVDPVCSLLRELRAIE